MKKPSERDLADSGKAKLERQGPLSSGLAPTAAQGEQSFVALNWLLGGLIIAFPFYLLPSGGPQISTAFGGCAILVALPHFVRLVQRPLVVWGILFVGYTIAVNGFYDLMLSSGGGMVKYSAFYVYNLALFITVLRASEQGDQFFDWLYKVVLTSIGLQTLLLPLAYVSGARNTLFFNNPNSTRPIGPLLSATCVVSLTLLRGQKLTRMEGAALLACAALVAVSQSKAALAGLGVILVIRMVTSWRGILAAIVVGMIASLLFAESDLVNSIGDRLSRIGSDPDDTFLGSWLRPPLCIP